MCWIVTEGSELRRIDMVPFSPHCCVGFLFFLLRLLAPPSSSSSAFRVPSFLLSTTTSLTQHLSQQTLLRETSHTQRLAYNITHTTSLTTTAQAHTQHHSHNIGCQGVGRTPLTTTSLREHPTHNLSHTTAHTQHGYNFSTRSIWGAGR